MGSRIFNFQVTLECLGGGKMESREMEENIIDLDVSLSWLPTLFLDWNWFQFFLFFFFFLPRTLSEPYGFLFTISSLSLFPSSCMRSSSEVLWELELLSSGSGANCLRPNPCLTAWPPLLWANYLSSASVSPLCKMEVILTLQDCSEDWWAKTYKLLRNSTWHIITIQEKLAILINF